MIIIYIIIFIFFIFFYFCYSFKETYKDYKLCEYIIDCENNKKDYSINFFLFIIGFVIIILFVFLLNERLYKEGYIDTIRENWKKTPIMNITIGNGKEKIGYFKNFENEKSQDIYNWQGITFNFIRKPNSYIYTNIIKNDNKNENYKKCGIDNEGTALYFYKDDYCPINYVKIKSSNETVPSEIRNLNYTVIPLNDNNYLYFTNEYIWGKILIVIFLYKIVENESINVIIALFVVILSIIAIIFF